MTNANTATSIATSRPTSHTHADVWTMYGTPDRTVRRSAVAVSQAQRDIDAVHEAAMASWASEQANKSLRLALAAQEKADAAVISAVLATLPDLD